METFATPLRSQRVCLRQPSCCMVSCLTLARRSACLQLITKPCCFLQTYEDPKACIGMSNLSMHQSHSQVYKQLVTRSLRTMTRGAVSAQRVHALCTHSCTSRTCTHLESSICKRGLDCNHKLQGQVLLHHVLDLISQPAQQQRRTCAHVTFWRAACAQATVSRSLSKRCATESTGPQSASNTAAGAHLEASSNR